MTRFLLKGLLRDHHRSLFPVIIVTAGVMTSILGYCFMHGIMDDMVRSNAKLDTGHVKVMTRAYGEISRQLPNDLAILSVSRLISDLERGYPQMEWAARIKFGGLLDLPDEYGETRSQGPAFGMALNLLGTHSREGQRLGLEKALVRGRLPQAPGEILVSEEFASRLEANMGDLATLVSSTAHGGMAVQNFTIVGSVRFGIAPMDTTPSSPICRTSSTPLTWKTAPGRSRLQVDGFRS